MGEDMEESNKTSTLARLSRQLASASLVERLTALETISLYVMGEDAGMEAKPVPLRAAGKFMLRMYMDGYYNEEEWREGVIGALCTTTHESPIDLFEAAQELLEDPKTNALELLVCVLGCQSGAFEEGDDEPVVARLAALVNLHCKLMDAVALLDGKALPKSKALRRARACTLNLLRSCPVYVPVYVTAWSSLSGHSVALGLLVSMLEHVEDTSAAVRAELRAATLAFFAKNVLAFKVPPSARQMDVYAPLLARISAEEFNEHMAPVISRVLKRGPESAAPTIAALFTALPTGRDEADVGAFFVDGTAALLRVFKSDHPESRMAAVNVVGEGLRRCSSESDKSTAVLVLDALVTAMAGKPPLGSLAEATGRRALFSVLGTAAVADSSSPRGWTWDADDCEKVLATALPIAAKEVDAGAREALMYSVGLWLAVLSRASAAAGPSGAAPALSANTVKALVTGLGIPEKSAGYACCIATAHRCSASGEQTLWTMLLPCVSAMGTVVSDVVSTSSKSPTKLALFAALTLAGCMLEAVSSIDGDACAAITDALKLDEVPNSGSKGPFEGAWGLLASKSGLYGGTSDAHWRSAASDHSVGAQLAVRSICPALQALLKKQPSTVVPVQVSWVVLAGLMHAELDTRTAAATALHAMIGARATEGGANALLNELVTTLYTTANSNVLTPGPCQNDDGTKSAMTTGTFTGRMLVQALELILPKQVRDKGNKGKGEGKSADASVRTPTLPLSATSVARLMLICGHPLLCPEGTKQSTKCWKLVRAKFDLAAVLTTGASSSHAAEDLSHTLLEAIFADVPAGATTMQRTLRVRACAAGCTAVALIDESYDLSPVARAVLGKAQTAVFQRLLTALEAPALLGVSREDAQVWASPEAVLSASLSTKATLTEDDLRLTNADRKKDGGRSMRKGGANAFATDLGGDEEWAEQMKEEKLAQLTSARSKQRELELAEALVKSEPMRVRVSVLVQKARAALGVITAMAESLTAIVAAEMGRILPLIVSNLDDSRPLLHTEAQACLTACIKFALGGTGDASAQSAVSHGVRATAVTIYRQALLGEKASAQLAAVAELSGAMTRGLHALKSCAAESRGQGLSAPALNLGLPLIHCTLVAATAPATPSSLRTQLPDPTLAFTVLEGMWNGRLEGSLLPTRPLLIDCCLRALSRSGMSHASTPSATGPEAMINRLASAHPMREADWEPIMGSRGVRSTSGAVRCACYALMGRCAQQSDDAAPATNLGTVLWMGQFDNLDYVREAATAAAEAWGLPTVANPRAKAHALPLGFHTTLLRLVAPRYFTDKEARARKAASQSGAVDGGAFVGHNANSLSELTGALSSAPASPLGGKAGARAAALAAAASAAVVAKVAGKALSAGMLVEGTSAEVRSEAMCILTTLYAETLPEAAAKAAADAVAAMADPTKMTKQAAATLLAAQNRLKAQGDEDHLHSERLLVAHCMSMFPAPTAAVTSGDCTWVLDILRFVSAQGCVDPHPNVRDAMLEAGNSLVRNYGALACKDMMVLFQKNLEESAPSGSDANNANNAKALTNYDRRHEAAVVLLGSTGAHLGKTDPMLLGITQTMVDALRTPSEGVQVAVADALVGLVSVLKTMPAQKQMLSDLFEALMEQAVTGESYGDRRGAAYGVAALVKARGQATLKAHDVIPRIREHATTGAINARQGGLFALETLSSRLGLLLEPYIISLMPVLIKSFSHGSDHVRQAARGAAQSIFSKISAHGIKQVMTPILEGVSADTQWKSRQEAVRLLGTMAHCAPRQLAQALPQIVPKLMECCADPHPKVKEAAKGAMSDISGVVKNPEVAGMSEELLAALGDPAKKTGPALEALLSCEFMHAIDAPSLGLLVPILGKGLRDRSAEIKRRACLITGNITGMVNDAKLLIPYLPQILPGLRTNVMDPIPDVRTHAAACMGALAAGVGERELGDTVSWLLESATGDMNAADVGFMTSDAAGEGAVERSGAAQAIAELCKTLGTERTEQILAVLMPARRSKRAGAREGLLWLLSFLPLSIGDGFGDYIEETLPVVLEGLSDDVDNVREVAMRAGQIVVNSLGFSHSQLLVPSLTEGMFSEKWRIRQSSLLLLGDLLLLVGEAENAEVAIGMGDGIMVKGKMGSAKAGDDEGSESDEEVALSANASTVTKLRAHMGKHWAESSLAAIYILRTDVSLAVRQSAGNVWKQLVSNTPRLLTEIMDQLVSRLVTLLASPEPELATIGGKALGETVKRLGDRVLPAVVPHLQRGLASENEGERRSACVGLSEVLSASAARQIKMYSSTLVPALIEALCDSDNAVRTLAAASLGTMLRTVGVGAIDQVLPSLLDSLGSALEATEESTSLAVAASMAAGNKGSDENIPGGATVRRAMVGLRTAVATRTRDMVDYLLPKLESEEVLIAKGTCDALDQFKGTRPLSHLGCFALVAVAGAAQQQMGYNLHVMVPLLARSHVCAELGVEGKDRASMAAVQAAATAVCGAIQDNGVNNMIDELGRYLEHEHPSKRELGCWLTSVFVVETDADFSEYIPILLRYLLGRCCDDNDAVLKATHMALLALGKAQPHEDLMQHLDFMRSCLLSTISDARHRAGAIRHPNMVVTASGHCIAPLFCLPKSLDPLLPIYTHALLKGSAIQKENAALAMGDLIHATRDAVLKPYLIKAVGPLIRVMGERSASSVKGAILSTLETLLVRGGVALKPFVPQLQTTFLKALSDPTKQVRQLAAQCLSALMPLSPRVDAVLTEVSSICAGAESAAIRASAVAAIAAVLARPEACKKASQPVLAAVAMSLQGLVVSEEDATRVAACAASRQLAATLPADDVTSFVADMSAHNDPEDTYRQMEGQLLACGGALGAARGMFRDSLSGATSDFLVLLTKGFAHAHPAATAAAARSIGLAVTLALGPASEIPEDVIPGGTPDLAALLKVATVQLGKCVAHDTPEVKEGALYAMKQLGRVVDNDQAVALCKTAMPPVLALLRTGDPRMKDPCERAARHVLLGKGTNADVETVDTSRLAAFIKQASSENQSFIRDYSKRQLMRQLDDSDTEE